MRFCNVHSLLQSASVLIGLQIKNSIKGIFYCSLQLRISMMFAHGHRNSSTVHSLTERIGLEYLKQCLRYTIRFTI